MNKQQIVKELNIIVKTLEEIIKDDKNLIQKIGNDEYYRGRITADTRTIRWLKEIIQKANKKSEDKQW